MLHGGPKCTKCVYYDHDSVGCTRRVGSKTVSEMNIDEWKTNPDFPTEFNAYTWQDERSYCFHYDDGLAAS